MANSISVEAISTKILLIRGKKVMLDRDLAYLYAVSTKGLNQAVKRNIERFPADFMFQLTPTEKEEVVTICDHLKVLKFSPQCPYAFTEQGVAMLSSVLNSKRAIRVNIQIMRAFVKLKELLLTHKELTIKIEALERRYADHNEKIKKIFEAIRQLMIPPEEPKRRIGFHAD